MTTKCTRLVKVWITKYWATRGVFCVQADLSFGQGMACAPSKPGFMSAHYHGREWWRTESEAIADFNRRRDAAIKQVQKKLARLESMTFAVTGETS